MAEGNSAHTPNSGASWTLQNFPFAGAMFPRQPHMAEQAARASLMGLELAESWLAGTRQMIDLWRNSVREMQNGMIASYRKHVVETFTHDVLEQLETPSRPANKRQPLSQSAVAKTGAANAA